MARSRAGWEGVSEVLRASLERGDDTGASVCVYHRGVPVVDIAGGTFTRDGGAYDRSTLQLVFSTTKGITAIAVGICAGRGLIDYDAPVTTYWPEFAAAGKGDATVAQLLSHQLGLVTVDGLTLEQALDWDTITAALAAAAPEWPIGSGHGYHALTYGWLAGELVRRVDGRSLGTFVTDEIAKPLGVDLWIGLPESEEPRVSPLIRDAPTDVPPEMQAIIDADHGTGHAGRPGAVAERRLLGGRRHVQPPRGPRRRDPGGQRDHQRRLAGQGLRRHDGSGRRRAAAGRRRPRSGPHQDHARRRERTSACRPRRRSGSASWSMARSRCTAVPGSYGHPGAGGSVAFADPDRDLAFAYVMNTMATNLAGDTRAQQLIDAAVRGHPVAGAARFLHSGRPMPAFPTISVGPVVRDPDEEHRASTPLELFVDLCFVVAVAQSAAALHHELVIGEVGVRRRRVPHGVLRRLVGVDELHVVRVGPRRRRRAVPAADAGPDHRRADLRRRVPRMVEDHDLTLSVIGYVIMRMALVTQWLRVARHFPELRARCLRYAVGITLLQLLWVLILAVPEQYAPWLFALLAIGELSIPQWAEGAARGSRYWRLFHAEHIEERYGLFTIIVLGESVLSATVGIQEVATRGVFADLIVVAAGGLLIAFGAWWIYFDHPGHLHAESRAGDPVGLRARRRVRLARRPRRRAARGRRGGGRRGDRAHRCARRRHPRRRLPRSASCC